MSISPIKLIDFGIELRLKIKPNASKQGFQEVVQGYLILGIHAQPKEGEANQAIIEFLAKYFKTPKTQIKLISGHKSRYKCLQINLKQNGKEICQNLIKTLNI